METGGLTGGILASWEGVALAEGFPVLPLWGCGSVVAPYFSGGGTRRAAEARFLAVRGFFQSLRLPAAACHKAGQAAKIGCGRRLKRRERRVAAG